MPKMKLSSKPQVFFFRNETDNTYKFLLQFQFQFQSSLKEMGMGPHLKSLRVTSETNLDQGRISLRSLFSIIKIKTFLEKSTIQNFIIDTNSFKHNCLNNFLNTKLISAN